MEWYAWRNNFSRVLLVCPFFCMLPFSRRCYRHCRRLAAPLSRCRAITLAHGRKPASSIRCIVYTLKRPLSAKQQPLAHAVQSPSEGQALGTYYLKKGRIGWTQWVRF